MRAEPPAPPGGVRGSCCGIAPVSVLVAFGGTNNKTRRGTRQGKSPKCKRRLPRAGNGAREAACHLDSLERLSATDISALASMKNVAKCDTWCELQNPVNHRVFERKLRPKPSGRGHICLGVTHRRPSSHRGREPAAGDREGTENGLPRAGAARGWLKNERRASVATTSGGATSH